MYAAVLVGQPFVARELGLHVPLSAPELSDAVILALIVAVGCLVGAIPAHRAYRLSLADGLCPRI